MEFDKTKYNKYEAFVQSVYDGDTITVKVSLGFGIKLSDQKIRLIGINAPEMKGDEKENGKITRDYVKEKINNKKIHLYTIPHKDSEKKGKYGRWLAYVCFFENEEEINLNSVLVEKELAKETNY